ncbi:hypothetical protein GGX14DRAFT_627415 [Mycena pura]|uniref:Uncharacterized protein n=1 Tax=Mycena pura TaxID=153505 RepID=A0AAD7E485_9AGAR|nr:hypothetical protein GGX14DRAFT_627415 [Mycena pura]
MSSRKRKNRQWNAPPVSATPLDDVDISPDPTLFIQAYEADIRRGPQAKQAASSLEIANQMPNRGSSAGLIQWNPLNSHSPPAFPSDIDAEGASASKSHPRAVWVDRYDARLLLDSLPIFTNAQSTPPSPSGWSALPSDTEDTFFLSPDEAADYHREKRRKTMDRAREMRLAARRAEDGEPEKEDIWGGSDEEPDEAQRLLMERTAASVASADNPAQLEMRILANYGADKRFAFLRGRWKTAWIAMKRDAQKHREAEKSSSSGLGNLADYGDSDEDEETEKDKAVTIEGKSDGALAARQARAKAWAESRRVSKESIASN